MSDTRRLRREAARQQAQRRLQKTLANRRKKLQEGRGLLRWPSLLLRKRSLYFIAALALVVLIGFPVLAPPTSSSPVEAPTPEALTPVPTPVRSFSPPPMQLSSGKSYSAVLSTTKGPIRIDLLSNESQTAVNNFVVLANNNYYNGLPIYKVQAGARVEAGARNEDGTGGPGYTLPAEPSPRPVEVGIVATVPQEENGLGGPFLIALADQPDLGAGYSAFGRVTDGLDVARQLRVGDRIVSIRINETEVQ